MSGRLTHAVLVIATAASLVVSPVYAQNQQAAPPPAQTDQTPGVLPPPPQYQPPTATQGPPPAPTRNLGVSKSADYSKSNSWFPNIIAPYTPMKVAKPELINTPRLNQLIQDGKLNLSLEDAISLGLENNLAIAVERYVPWLDEASLLLSKSGVNGRIQFDPTLTSTISLDDATRERLYCFSPHFSVSFFSRRQQYRLFCHVGDHQSVMYSAASRSTETALSLALIVAVDAVVWF